MSNISIQNSIADATLSLICPECPVPCRENTKCLEVQSLFTKILSFENCYLTSYTRELQENFQEFILEATNSFKAKITYNIDQELSSEFLKGVEDKKSTENLTKLYFALYWAGMYFVEEVLAEEDEIEILKVRLNYDFIVNCMKNFCVDIDVLRSLFFKEKPPVSTVSEIYSFQFDGIEKSSMDLVTEAFLLTSATLEDIQTLLNGKQITYTKLGRVGFAIKGDENNFRVYDALGNDITDTVFNSSYEEERRVQIYLSKEYYVPSTIYYKFIKI